MISRPVVDNILAILSKVMRKEYVTTYEKTLLARMSPDLKSACWASMLTYGISPLHPLLEPYELAPRDAGTYAQNLGINMMNTSDYLKEYAGRTPSTFEEHVKHAEVRRLRAECDLAYEAALKYGIEATCRGDETFIEMFRIYGEALEAEAEAKAAVDVDE